MRIFALICLFAQVSTLHASGIFGRVSDQAGLPLPFANVFIEGSTRGCATNLEGYFELELEPGSYTVVARFLGYATERKSIVLGNSKQELNFLLAAESLTLQDVLISGAEDPGMGIMRKAIANREIYRRETNSFSVDAYIKGLQRIDAAPDKILGIRIDAGDILDSNNAGIVYLSESYSRLHVKNAGTAAMRTREEMFASKVSGNDQGFSWNEAAPMEISFYEPRMDVSGVSERKFVSPLADDAFFFYRFVFAGTLIEDGYLINKIEVIPRRKQDPVYRGYIYIVEDSWRIYGTDMLLTQDAGIEFVDSLSLQMTYTPIDSAHWMPVSRQFRFKFGLLGIKGQGYFLAFYSNYALEPEFEKRLFGPEYLAIQDGANKLDSGYWANVRPVPLSELEAEDYLEKEILEKKRESKDYLDSLDRESNALQITNVLLGYSNENSFRKSRWYLNSPINSIGFNTVEGWFIGTSGGWNREVERNRIWRVSGNTHYGIGNGRLQADARVEWLNDMVHFQRLYIAGGKKVTDYHPDAISNLVNSTYTLLLKRNYLKLYESRFAEAGFSRELFNGLKASAKLQWADRIPLRNTSESEWIKWDEREYTSNDPLDETNMNWPFEPNKISLVSIQLRYQIGQRYATEPDRRYIIGSKWPALRLSYTGAYPVLGSSLDYSKMEGSIEYTQDLGLWGKMDLLAVAGGFADRDSLTFLDFHHFRGNQTVILRTELRRFNTLPYFTRSTNQNWLELHAEHHFNGFIFNKIPGVRKLRWQLVAGGHALKTPVDDWYAEMSIGIEHIFKVVRVDFAAGWGDPEPAYNVLVGIGF